MTIHRITEEEFHLLREEWNDLLSRSASDGVFLRWEWIHTWWSIFGSRFVLMILAVKEEGRLVGIAPFYVETSGLFRFRCLRLCSEGLSPDYMDVIAPKGRESDVLRAVSDYLADHSREWDEIRLANLLEGSLLMTRFSPPANWPIEKLPGQPCPYIQIAGRFDDYYKSRKTLLSFALERKHRKLQREKNAVHVTVGDAACLGKGLDDLFRLHEKRAEHKGLRSNFTGEDVHRFHRELSRAFLDAGILNLQLLYAGEDPVAALYAFNYRKKLYQYQTGFDPDYKSVSAGMLIVRLAVEKAFREGLSEFDFLKGEESYKGLWSDTAREQFTLVLYPATRRGSLLRTWRKGRSFLGRLRRRARSTVQTGMGIDSA